MDKTVEPQDETRFFEHGQVSFAYRDFPTRLVALDITAPCCLFQAAVPQLLGAGYIDHPRIHNPVSIWMPRMSKERFNILTENSPAAPEQVNVAVRAWLQQLLNIFEKLSVYLIDPSDLIPMLPLGVYIDCRWRVRIDDILKVMEGLQALDRVAGIYEFQWALACVLQCVLEDYEKWEQHKLKALPTAT